MRRLLAVCSCAAAASALHSMGEHSTQARDTPTRLSEQTLITPIAPPLDDSSINSLLTFDDDEEPESVSRGCVLALFDTVAFVTACAAGALGAMHAVQLTAFATAPAPRGGIAGAVFAASISYQCLLCICIVAFELHSVSHETEGWTGRYWSVRGLLYAFLGVIALPGAAADAATTATQVTMKEGELVCVPGVAAQTLEKARVVAACAVIATGALYVLLGLCCCRGIRRGAQLRYRRRLAHADLQRAFLAKRAYRTGGGVAEA